MHIPAVSWSGIAVLAALFAIACGDDDSDVGQPARDADVADAASDAGDAGDAGLSGYGDGTCTDREVMEGIEAIETSRELAAGGPGLVSAFVDRNQQKLDGIWEDCQARLCPVIAEIYAECSAQFVDPNHDDDAGPPPGNPCGAAPPECDPYL